jgi:hypothetical protein
MMEEHKHTSACWITPVNNECFIYRINELEMLLQQMQGALRMVGGSLDKVETAVTKILELPKNRV